MTRVFRHATVALLIFSMSSVLPSAVSAGGPDLGVDVAVLKFQEQITTAVAPVARSLPEFAGIYIESLEDQRAVVLLTAPNATAESSFRELGGTGTIEVRYVPHSYLELQAAIDALWAASPRVLGVAQPVAIGLNTIANSLDVYVEAADAAAARSSTEAVQDLLGVPVSIIESPPVQEFACTDRDHCTSPMKAGNRVREGGVSGPVCTMAFHIRMGTDEQFLTAGHCTWDGPRTWYHQGLGVPVGDRISNGMVAAGIDMARVQMPDAQASASIYGTTSLPYFPVYGMEWPVVGASVSKSAGMSQAVYASTIQDDYLTWTSPTCKCVVHGGKMAATPGMAGDSGSPIYATHSNYKAYAIGTDSGSLGSSTIFARVADAANFWGFALVTG